MPKLPQHLIDLDLPATERQIAVIRRATALVGVDFGLMEFRQEPLPRWLATQVATMFKREAYENSAYYPKHKEFRAEEFGVGSYTFDAEKSARMAQVREGIERIQKGY